jgi:large subunit ribosomal protein L35
VCYNCDAPGKRLVCAFTRIIVGLNLSSNRNMERRIMKQKLKTHKAMAKRVKITGSGKILRRKIALNHLRRNKSPRAVRSMDKYFPLATSDTRRMKRLLPYGN